MIRQIKNSSGKITGTTTINEENILIDNIGKPLLTITDKNIIKEVIDKNISEKTLIILYNIYTMSIGEIASLYDRCYSAINKLIKKTPDIKIDHRGRRNRAYGHKVSEQQSQRMSAALKGRAASYYERTDEIKQKISTSLKQYFQLHPQNPEPHRKNWAKGVYDNVDFKHGISGHFHSIKNDKTYRFRSLLELYMMIQLENDTTVINYKYEPFHIPLDNGGSYLPDFLINEKIVVELKAKKYVERVQGVQEKVNYKKSQAIKYCNQHQLEYKIVYDEDIGFNTKRMKAELKNNPELINKYNITFIDVARMV